MSRFHGFLKHHYYARKTSLHLESAVYIASRSTFTFYWVGVDKKSLKSLFLRQNLLGVSAKCTGQLFHHLTHLTHIRLMDACL